MTLKTKIIKVVNFPKIIKYLLCKQPDLASKYDGLRAKELCDKKFNTIIDVGANEGYYTKSYAKFFPEANIYSFEPVTKCYRLLSKLQSSKVHTFNFALGSKNNIGDMKVNFDVSAVSSMLSTQYKNERNVGYEQVQIRRFDSLNISIKKPSLLKVDVEGYELEVLKGFGKLLNDIDVAQIEVNFGKNIIDHPKASEIINLLEEYGFEGFIQDNFKTDLNGKVVQCDLFFYKKIGLLN